MLLVGSGKCLPVQFLIWIMVVVCLADEELFPFCIRGCFQCVFFVDAVNV